MGRSWKGKDGRVWWKIEVEINGWVSEKTNELKDNKRLTIWFQNAMH